jgi:tRNA1Val (adenine37-N6)-methyltransferase
MSDRPREKSARAKKGFQFKKFEIRQENCVVKVGTLGCTLGAFAFHPGPGRILDIGTGTGLLALMLAQRYPGAMVDAVEIDALTCHQARKNIARSPWSDRITVHLQDVEVFSPESTAPYPLIVSNPPFYERHLRSADPRTNIARHDGTMTMSKLLGAVHRLLDDSGHFFLLLPVQQMERFTTMALRQHLYPMINLRIFNFAGGQVKAMIRGFSFDKATLKNEDLTICSSVDQYTEKFRTMLRDFYLNF